ncbi:MAG: hypothetical protein EXR79_10395 [Myxococcales bacterium]|nr:hypothetical protein [Myxococcales bacterium]
MAFTAGAKVWHWTPAGSGYRAILAAGAHTPWRVKLAANGALLESKAVLTDVLSRLLTGIGVDGNGAMVIASYGQPAGCK